MTGGKGIAYGAFRPLQGDVATDILNAEDQEFKHRQEKRLEADRAAAAKAAKDKARKEGLKRVKNIQLEDTESDTLNSTLAEAVKTAQAEYPKIFEILDNPDRFSSSEQIQAQLKLDYLNGGGLVNDLKKMTSGVLAEYQDYKAKAGKIGGYYTDEDYEKKFENGYKGVIISLDDNLRPVTLFKSSGVDADGDGIIDIETMGSLEDATQRPSFQTLHSIEADLDAHAKQLQPSINTDANGFLSTKTTALEPEILESETQRILYDRGGNPSPKMRSFLRNKGLEDTPENRTIVENDYKNGLLIRNKRGKEEKFDSGAFVANKREKRLSKEETTNRLIVDFDYKTAQDEFANKNISQDGVEKKMISVPEGQIKFKNLGGDKTSINEGFVTGFALKGGDVLVTGKALKTKNAKVKVGNDIMSVLKATELAEQGNTEAQEALNSYSVPNNYGKFIRKVSGTELGSFASKAGYESVEDLKAELKSINKKEVDEYGVPVEN